MEHLQQRGPQDGLLQRRDAVESPALGVLRDLLVELGRVVGGRVRERARERRGVPVEDVVERPAGQVVLVEGEDGGAVVVVGGLPQAPRAGGWGAVGGRGARVRGRGGGAGRGGAGGGGGRAGPRSASAARCRSRVVLVVGSSAT